MCVCIKQCMLCRLMQIYSRLTKTVISHNRAELIANESLTLFLSSRNLDSLYGGCVWVEAWQAYCCRGLQHHMLVSESMDDDTETRRLSPLALNGGDTGAGHYTDLLNGPMDHGTFMS